MGGNQNTLAYTIIQPRLVFILNNINVEGFTKKDERGKYSVSSCCPVSSLLEEVKLSPGALQ